MTDKVKEETRYSVSDVVGRKVCGSAAHACVGVCPGLGPANDERGTGA